MVEVADDIVMVVVVLEELLLLEPVVLAVLVVLVMIEKEILRLVEVEVVLEDILEQAGLGVAPLLTILG
jgi:hypothetical protein